MVIVERQTDLLEVVAALHSPGRLARRLHGRQQHRDQDADDRDDHEELNQRKAAIGISDSGFAD
jgi:hypothetical protein